MTTPVDPRHERWDELAAGFALHALEPDEESEFRAHLDTCEQCHGLLDEHALVAAQLGALAEASEPAAPPWSSIREGILTGRAPVALSLDAHRDDRRRRAARMVGAAAAAALLAGAAIAGWQLTGSGTTHAPRARALAAVSRCEHMSGCHVFRLRDNSSTTRAAVVVRGDSAALWPMQMPGPATAHEYALWQLPRDGGPKLLSVVRSVAAATGAATPLTLPYADTAAFAISVEPDTTTPTKPTDVVAIGTGTV